MLTALLQLIILFVVIFDPPASLLVFVTTSEGMAKKERRFMALLAVVVASGLSFLVLMFGQKLLELFSTTLDEFRIAGGIILGILGVRMALGIPLTNVDKLRKNSGRAIAAIIGTPLLTGPAAITAIIMSVQDYGISVTGLAVSIVLATTALMFYLADFVIKFIGKTAIHVMSTVFGLITLSWGVKFATTGLLNIIA